jgi:hypothetical protein
LEPSEIDSGYHTDGGGSYSVFRQVAALSWWSRRFESDIHSILLLLQIFTDRLAIMHFDRLDNFVKLVRARFAAEPEAHRTLIGRKDTVLAGSDSDEPIAAVLFGIRGSYRPAPGRVFQENDDCAACYAAGAPNHARHRTLRYGQADVERRAAGTIAQLELCALKRGLAELPGFHIGIAAKDRYLVFAWPDLAQRE